MRILDRLVGLIRAARAARDDAVLRDRARVHLWEMDRAQTGVLVTNVAGRYVTCNAAFRALTGYTQADLDRLRSPEVMAPSQRERIRALREMRLQGRASPDEFETAVVHRDGTVIPVLARASALHLRTGVAATVLEVADLRRIQTTEEHTRLVRESLEHLAYAAPVPMVVTDAEWRVQLWSPAAQRRFGWSVAEVEGRPLPLWPAERLEAFRREARDVRSLAPLTLVNERCATRGGRSLTVDARVSVMRDGDRLTGFVVSLEDVVDREEAERARELSRVRDEFLHTMNHELRTPLHSILGFSELLDGGISGPLNPEQREHVHDIRSAGQHLLALVTDMLDVATIDLGDWRTAHEPVGLAALAADAIDEIRAAAEERGLAVTLDAPEEVEITADARSVRLILLHLLTNALKFTDRGTVSVVVRQDGDTAILRVSDTGIGIDERDQRRLFDDFVQLRQRGGRLPAGTGLGLALVRRLVDLSGGTIDVESTEGVGSTFTVRLPGGMTPR
jgi:PAS domain S-box-containing protein